MRFINPSSFTTRPEIEGTFGAVVTTHWIATAVGMSILEKGGAVPPPHTLFRNPALADTYERIIRETESAGDGREQRIEAARKAWSQGFVAEAVGR